MSVRVKAFTLIEMLVVIFVISLLLAIVLPVFNAVKAQGKSVVCKSNIRQLALANSSYANENNGHYAPASLDIFGDEPDNNNHRWHGVRDSKDEPFDASRGPLSPYLDDVSLQCPAKVRFKQFEYLHPKYDSGGGYGYNMTYIGSKIWASGYEDVSCKDTTREVGIARPSLTLMFADTAAIYKKELIEYSFAEPRYFIANGKPVIDAWNPEPSIHFRHRKRANIAWADGHADSEKIAKSDVTNPDGTKPSDMNIGWFEPMDNSMFDLK
jgi:prepilin-type N-terminal cleavage/methylation domain-containing protein/prepilin-type processing-associated H-X9-DG protein